MDNKLDKSLSYHGTMALGQKLFEEVGKIASFKVIKVHPLEGITTEVSFMSDIKGIEKCPSGKNLVSGTMTKYPHRISDAALNVNLNTQNAKDFKWWAQD